MVKLIFFDIDGTLIYHTHSDAAFRMKRYAYAIKKAWNIDVPVEMPKYEGWIDRGMTWEIVSRYGISRQDFLSELPVFTKSMRQYMDTNKEEAGMYKVIPEAFELLQKLDKFPGIHLAVLTGNMESMGHWKLEHADISEFFQFGIYGDEADSKVELGASALEKASAYFQEKFEKNEVVVIGDTPFDVECGKAMGVKTVGVITGKHNVSPEQFVASGADLVASSLIDPQFLNFLGVA